MAKVKSEDKNKSKKKVKEKSIVNKENKTPRKGKKATKDLKKNLVIKTENVDEIINKINIITKNNNNKELKKVLKTKTKDEKVTVSEDIKDNKTYIKRYKFNKEKFVRYLLIFILSCVFIFSVTKLVLNQIDMFRNRRDSKNLVKEVIKWPSFDGFDKENNGEASEGEKVINPEEVRVDFNRLKTTNPDTIGWMMFNNMAVNNPVVHTGDNEYYLYHNFYKKDSEIGTLFMDHRNKSFDDRNVVIFGHSTIDRTMFGSLSDVFKSGFFNKENADIIYFYDTNNNLLKYKIFSYYTIESEEYYITTNFKSDESFGEFLNVIKGRSIGKLNVDVNVSDKIVTLSTCAGSRGSTKRRVIHAKRI